MPAVLADRPLRPIDIAPGAYVSHCGRLMWVAAVFEGQVALEDCMRPSDPLQLKKLRDLLRGSWRLVRPA